MFNLNAKTLNEKNLLKIINNKNIYYPMKGEGAWIEIPTKYAGIILGVPTGFVAGISLASAVPKEADSALFVGVTVGFILGDFVGQYVVGLPLYCTKVYLWEAPLDYMFDDNDKIEDFIVEYGWVKPKYYFFTKKGLKKNYIVKYLIIEPKNILFGEKKIEDGIVIKYGWVFPKKYIWEVPLDYVFDDNDKVEDFIVEYLWTIPTKYLWEVPSDYMFGD